MSPAAPGSWRASRPSVWARGRVVGLDINAGMLAVARSLPPRAGLPIEWHEGSALNMPFPDAAFDLVLCQLGLQFFPDRPAALREMRRVLSPSGRLGLSVYSSIEHNPVAYALADALDRHLGPGASASRRSEHALSDADKLRGLVDGGGLPGRDDPHDDAEGQVPVAERVRADLRWTPPRRWLAWCVGWRAGSERHWWRR